MKIAVIIPTHCPPSVINLTVGTLLRTHSQHDLNIHIGAHSNYKDYYSDLSLFEDLRKIASIHLVDEIDWMEHRKNLNRYSLMHSKNLENLFHQIQYYDFDYLLILDHDLMLKTDFVTEITKLYPQADLLGALFDDTDKMWKARHSGDGIEVQVTPRMVPWCLLLSRKLYKAIITDLSVMRPLDIYDPIAIANVCKHYGSESKLPIFSDTFAWVLYKCKFEWGMNLGIVTKDQMEKWVHHFFCGSFNYGQWAMHEKHGPHITEIEKIYRETFPNGINKR